MHSPHIIAFCGWLLGWVLQWRFPKLERASDPVEPGDPADPDRRVEPDAVTIIIPARNEAGRIRTLLDSLQLYRPVGSRVIVVDDHSDDGTADVVRSYDFTEVVSPPALPAGWLGKPWASHNGVSHASPGLLVFLDADIWVDEGGLDNAVEAWRRHQGLVSVYPYHIVRKPYEQLSILFQILAVMGTGAGSLFGWRKPDGAFGTTLLTSTEDYEATGGYTTVRNDVIEDFAIARLYRSMGKSVRVYGGYDDLSVRLYPDGIGGLLEGWTKSLARGAHTTPILRLAGLVTWMTCSLGSLTWVHGPWRWESGVLYALFVTQIFILGRQIGRYHILTALLYPVCAVFFLGVFVWSILKTFLRGQVQWRGRDIDMRSQGNAPNEIDSE